MAEKPLTGKQRAAQENRQAREEAKYTRHQRDRRRELARKPGEAAAAVTQRKSYELYTARNMLTAELIAGVLIVAIRAVADYEPQQDGTIRGKVGHPKGQYGPLPILAGLIVSFFLLSFLAASGGTKARLAVIAGGIIDLGLLMNSTAEFSKVAAVYSDFGKAKAPPGDWQTSGTAAGAPIQGSLSGGGSSGSGMPTKPGKDGKCPKGYKLVNGKCWADVAPGRPLT